MSPGKAASAPAQAALAPIIVTGSDVGSLPLVKVFDAQTGAEKAEFLAYPSSFLGGVRVACADLTGDGTPDIITAPGPGGPPEVRVFDGHNFKALAGPLGGFLAYTAASVKRFTTSVAYAPLGSSKPRRILLRPG